MDAGVDMERDLARFARAAPHPPVKVADDLAACRDLLQQKIVRIDEEELTFGRALLRKQQRVVVADLLVPAAPRYTAAI